MTIGWWIAIICGITCAGVAIAHALIGMADAYDCSMGLDAEEGGDE